MYSLLIKNATIVDGTGKPEFSGEVAVEGDQIVNVAERINSNARTVVDAQGLVLAPGFIDIQNHSDSYWQIFENPELVSLTSQGYTTILVGACGASLAPLLSPHALYSIQKWHALEGLNVNWQSFSDFLSVLHKQHVSCNIASLVGYSTIRRGILGDQVRPLDKSELNTLKKILKESLKEGAFGMSSGLSYSHEVGISTLELSELAKILKEHEALYSVHLRNEAGEVVEALEEALDIARTTEVNLKISHLKIRGQHNWQHFTDMLDRLETAKHRGMSVHFDLYPYDTTWQALYTYLPKWAMEGGRGALLKHLANPVQRNKILTYLSNSGVQIKNLMVASTANKLNVAGKRVSQIAKNMELSSEQAVLHLIQNGGSEVLVFEQNLDPAQVRMLMMHPLSFIGSDGGGFGLDVKDKLVHPRCFGSATKFIHDSLHGKMLPLTEIVRKLTSAPAKKIGIEKRGTITIGNYADLVLLDPKTVVDKATYENPYQLSRGIAQVYVNGEMVYESGRSTGSLPGYVLRKT